MTSSILVERTNIGIFGKTNAGKSTLMNLLTNQETSIVDGRKGTTADVKSTVMEMHGFGAIKIFDTAGLDERSSLGEKKKFKSLQALKECDLALLVVEPIESSKARDFSAENEVVSLCRQYDKQVFLVYNLFSGFPEKILNEAIENCNEGIFNSGKTKKIALDLHALGAGKKIIDFIKRNYLKEEKAVELLPFLKPYAFVAMNIPIDEETPAGRLLRPQNAVLDYLLRRLVPFAGYRMDLAKARSRIKEVSEEERQKYLSFLRELNGKETGLQLVITDSQAIDVVADWTPKEIPLTTFSIIMINHQSRGNLGRFVEGLKALEELKESDRLIVAEACNHDRMCDDIGTKQIPRRLKEKLGFKPKIDFAFGREFPAAPEELKKYKLIIHCGGCMVDSQKVGARMNDLLDCEVPITNYGLVLSWIKGKEALARVLAPWGL